MSWGAPFPTDTPTRVERGRGDRGRASAPWPFSRLLFPREVALGAPGPFLSGRPYPWIDCGSGSVSGQESRPVTVGSSVSRFELAFSFC